MAHASDQLLTSLLKEVSRSFYLTVRVLPGKIRSQIGLAYLLARTTDTIADTELVPEEKRLEALQALRERILGTTALPLKFDDFTRQQSSAAEASLVEKCEESLALLANLSAADLQLVRDCLNTIISGQELDLRRFANDGPVRLEAGASEGGVGRPVIALRTDEELDDYIYRVGGCVGEFWTRICRAHLFPRAPVDEVFLLINGVRFGKGLQLVNILRDLPADLRHGRCYLPEEKLTAHGLRAEELLEPANETRFRPLYNSYLERAQAHLLAGWEYTKALPRGCALVRLACAWPIMIGLETIKLLGTQKVLDPNHKIKISRARVKQQMLRSTLLYPWPRAWNRLAWPAI
ncbi:MAG: farnesyl-diphosphate farnesyltransferase [Verrucomicrobia bacterium]|nr:MAG: farnesyl-diphosphate farnesyltransferase [Verrucomicrobiota bacterium]